MEILYPKQSVASPLIGLLLFLLLLLPSVQSYSHNWQANQTYSKVEIEVGQKSNLKPIAELGLPLDCGVQFENGILKGEFSERDIKAVKEAGFKVKILIADMQEYYIQRAKQDMIDNPEPEKKTNYLNKSCTDIQYEMPFNFSLGTMAGFFTYEEFLGHIDNMFFLYPDLITAKQEISPNYTHEGRPIYWLKISDQPNIDEDEPEILYTAIHHAREPMSMSQLIFYMYYLLENYHIDPDIKAIVDNTEMYFIPCINPDGYVYNQTTNPLGGGFWRKNRRDNADGNFGVDLNRNYDFMWAFDDTGSSPSTGSSTYRGPSGFSEPETQNIRDFCNAHEFKICLNYHAYGNLLIYPWGFQEDLVTDDDTWFRHLTTEMTWYNRYKFGTTNQTVNYLVNGDSDDWMYGDESTKAKIYALTPEVGKTGLDGFWPVPSRILPISKENIHPNLTAARLAGRLERVRENSSIAKYSNSDNLDIEFKRDGQESGVTTIKVHPAHPKITTGTLQFTNFGSPLSSIIDYPAPFNLDPSISPDDVINFCIELDNNLYIEKTFVQKWYQPTEVFKDDLNNSLNWEGDWFITQEDTYSEDWAFTDSPLTTYNSNELKTISTKSFIDLTDASEAVLEFWATWDIEPRYDYVQVQASTDDLNWQPLCGRYTKPGSEYQIEDSPLYDSFENDWVKEEIDLSDFIGQSIKLRFMLATNSNTDHDGFYFDDIRIYKRTKPNLNIRLKAYLEGPYDISTGKMESELLNKNLLPYEQPFAQAPWNYYGDECFALQDIPLFIHPIVDWVFIEIRDQFDPTIVVAQKAALLCNNGIIVDPNASSDLEFKNLDANGLYHISIKARNHLAIVSNGPVMLIESNLYNFTTSVSTVKGTDQLTPVDIGKYALRAGDIDGNGTIITQDFNQYIVESSAINQYIPSDLNMDGNVTVSDFNLYQPNSSFFGVNEIRY